MGIETVGILLLAGIGFWFWQARSRNKKLAEDVAAALAKINAEHGTSFSSTNAAMILREFFQSNPTFTNLVQRIAYFTSAYATSPGMVVDLVEKGAKLDPVNSIGR